MVSGVFSLYFMGQSREFFTGKSFQYVCYQYVLYLDSGLHAAVRRQEPSKEYDLGNLRDYGVLVKRYSLVILGAALLLLVACESKDTKKSAMPVTQALAPSSHKSPEEAAAAPKQQATPTATQTPQQEKADPVPAIIAEAEKAYEAGQADYKAGHMDAAKQDFNRAVDVLMQGPVDIKSDERLQAEFDRITDEINKLETQAFKEGDGFAEQVLRVGAGLDDFTRAFVADGQ